MAVCLQFEMRQYVEHGSSYSQISQGEGVCAHLDEKECEMVWFVSGLATLTSTSVM